MKAQRGKLKDMTPVERSVFSRERGIARMLENIQRIRQAANEDIAKVEARIKEKQVLKVGQLVDALKRGRLKA